MSIQPRRTVPLSRSSGSTRRAVATGTAKPMPTEVPVGEKIMVLMPIMRPPASSSGPPELPGLMEASVWIICWMMRPSSASTGRPRPETMPVVSDRSWPNGLPIASTFWPTRRSVESPNGITVSGVPPGSKRITARSFSGSAPTSAASCSLPSQSVTVRRVAFLITWWLVSTWPSASMITPEPESERGMGR